MVSIWMKLRGEQGQGLMQPYRPTNNQNYDGKLCKTTCLMLRRESPTSLSLCLVVPVLADKMGMAPEVQRRQWSAGRKGEAK